MTKRGNDFAGLVYQILVAEKRWSVEEIAPQLGLTYDTLYARVRNRVTFSADEICKLICVAPDPRFVAYLLRGSPFVAADRVEGPDHSDDEAIHRGATRIVIEATDVLVAIEEALRDQQINHREKTVIHREIEIAERALASLREKIRAAG